MKTIFLSGLFILAFALTSPAQHWDFHQKKVASTRAAFDNYGCSVALSGNYIITGAPNDGENATGGAFMSRAGCAYILERNASGNWVEVQKLVASDRQANAKFGTPVHIDGNYAIVGAPYEDKDSVGVSPKMDAGAVYIFERNASGTWVQVQKITAIQRTVQDLFGFSVAISGNTIFVGAPYTDTDANGNNPLSDAGAVYVFKKDFLGVWHQAQKLVPSSRAVNDHFGLGYPGLSVSGDNLAIGAYGVWTDETGGVYLNDAGAVYTFERNASDQWVETQKLVAADRTEEEKFGQSVSIHGDYLVAGCSGDGEDASGASFISDAGSAVVFKRNTSGTWVRQQKLLASDRAAGQWFGHSVKIWGNRILVGALLEQRDENSLNPMSEAGAAYTFELSPAGNWEQTQKLVSIHRNPLDQFGSWTELEGETMIITGNHDGEDELGNNFLSTSGSMFIYEHCATYSTDVQTSCGSFTWMDGHTYTNSTDTARYVLTNAAGCDSIIRLNLTITSTDSTITTNACNTYTLNGITYTSSGTYTQVLTNAVGCDSTITLNLAVNAPTDSTITTDVCDSYSLNGTTYTTSGTYMQTLTNTAGCDSTITLNLTIRHATVSTITAAACNSYTFNGTTYTSSGMYTQTFTNAAGCDSIVTLDLTIHTPTASTITTSACNSYLLNGTTYTTSGTYTQTLTNAAGCDSTITLNLTINIPTASTITTSACNSYLLNGTTYTSSGIYIQTLTNAEGCDSTITLMLTINTPTASTTNASACDSYTFNSTTYTSSGTYTQTLTNAAGCDSTLTLNLVINHSSSSTDIKTACETYTWINGITYTASTNTPTFTLTNAMGCDSTVTLNLSINSVDINTSLTGHTLTASATGAVYQWLNCPAYTPVTGATTQTFTPSANGTYAVLVTQGTCSDTSACTMVTGIGLHEIENKNILSVYPNPSSGQMTVVSDQNGKLNIVDMNGKTVGTFTLVAGNNQLNVSYLPAGVYAILFNNTPQTRWVRAD